MPWQGTLDGSITVRCPGTLTIHAAKKSFSGPVDGSYPLPEFPRGICVDCLKKALAGGSAFTQLA